MTHPSVALQRFSRTLHCGKSRHPFMFSSLECAWRDFLGAQASGGYGTNESLIGRQVGSTTAPLTKGGELDSVREALGRKKIRGVGAIRTFKDAFKACFGGHKDWRRFRLDVLRDVDGPEMHNLQLPEHIEAALEREAIAEEHAHRSGDVVASHAGAEYREEILGHTAEAEHPPLELLRRAGPKSRKKRGPSKLRQSVRALAHTYRQAKRAYHDAGEQLHMAKISGLLL